MSGAQAMRRAADALLVCTAASATLSITGMQIGIVGLFALAVLGRLAGVSVIRATPFDTPLALLGAVLLVSTLASGRPQEAAGYVRLWVVIGYFGVYWWLTDAERVARCWRVFVGTAALVAVYAIVQHFTGIDWYRDLAGRPRAVAPRVAGGEGYAAIGFFSNYLTFGDAMLLPLGGAAAAAVAPAWPAVFAAGAMVAAIVFSTARGAWLAALTMGLALVLIGRSRRVLALLAALVVVGAVLLAASPGLRAQVPPLASLGGVNQHRLAIYRANLDIVAAHPVFGLGFGRYRPHAKPYYEPYPLADRRSHAHNNFLQMAAEAGLPGVAAFTFLFAMVLRRALAALPRAASGWARLCGTVLGVVGFLAAGLTQYTFGDNEVAIGMWLTLAVLAREVEAAEAAP
jgi:O-antigen ligase